MTERRHRPYTNPRLRELDPEEGRRRMAAAGEDPGTKDKRAEEEGEPLKKEREAASDLDRAADDPGVEN